MGSGNTALLLCVNCGYIGKLERCDMICPKCRTRMMITYYEPIYPVTVV
jgi:Zn finger protein HypA/HybF involved in hydrogenase expression